MGKTLKAGVIGWPVEHSLSPRLHGYWLKNYGIDGSYEALAAAPEKLEQKLRKLKEEGFRGVNLTIPHKEAALALVDRLDATAKRIGAVNTVIVGDDGKLEGRNSDAFGFAQNLTAAGVEIKNQPVTILGAGGAARAVVVALQDMGAKEIRLINRTNERAEQLAQAMGVPVLFFPHDSYRKAMEDTALLVNTTSVGMQSNDVPPFWDEASIPKDAVVTDIVYRPLMTALLKRAHHHGNKIVDGLGMLLHQARPAFAAFYGREPDVTDRLRSFVLEAQ